MKRPCLWCKGVYDDGKPLPPGATAENMLKSHGVCPKCTPAFTAHYEAQLRELSQERGLKENQNDEKP